MRCPILSLLLMFCMTSDCHASDTKDNGGIEGLKANLDLTRMHRSGMEVTIFFDFTNSFPEEVKGGAYMAMDESLVAVDGKGNYNIETARRMMEFPAGKTVTMETWIPKLPLDAKSVTFLKLVGRADRSRKVSEDNCYGDFDYTFTDIRLPDFHESNRPGCFFYDSDMTLFVGDILANGKDLVVNFTLTNHGSSDYNILPQNFGGGTARTAKGDEYSATTEIPSVLPTEKAVNGRIVIYGAADAMLSSIKQGFILRQDRSTWMPELLLQNISRTR